MLKLLEKEMSKEMCSGLCIQTHIFWEVEMNSYHSVGVFTMSELIKQKKNNGMNNCLLFRIFKFFCVCAK